MNRESKKKLRLTIIIVAIFSIFTVLALCGKYANLPQAMTVTVDNALMKKRSENGSVIIDSSAERVIILNRVDTVVNTLETQNSGDRMIYYSAVAIGEDAIYVGEYERYENSIYVQQERIIKYSFQGKELGIVLQIDHDLDNDRTLDPVINDIVIHGSEGRAICLNAISKVLSITYFDTENLWEKAEKAEKAENAESISPIQQVLSEPEGDSVVHALFSSSDADLIIVRGASGDFYTVSIDAMESETVFVKAYALYELQAVFSMDVNADGAILLQYTCSSEGSTFAYDLMYVFHQSLFWLCSLYLILLAVFLVVRYIVQCIRNHRSDRIMQMEIGVVVTLLCIGIVAFYNTQLASHIKESHMDSLSGYVALLTGTNSQKIERGIEEFLRIDRLTEATRDSLNNVMEQCALAMTKADQNIVFTLIARSEEGKCCLLADSCGRELNGQRVEISWETIEALKQGNGMIIKESNTVWGTNFICLQAIKDEQGEIEAMVIAQEDMHAFQTSLRKECFNLLITLLSSMIMLGFAIFEIGTWKHCFAKRKKLLAEGISHAEYSLSRPIMFLTVAATSANSALLPIIVKEIAHDSPYVTNAFLMSLPVTIYSLGYLVGTPIRKWLSTKVSAKKVLCGSTGIAILGYFCCFIAVLRSNLILFTLSIFCTNAMLAVSSSYAYGLPFYAGTSQERAETNRSIAAAFISSSSIIGLLAGTLSEKLGNAPIQLLGMGCSILLLIFLLLMIPADTKTLARSTEKEHGLSGKTREKGGKFLTDPSVLALLFCMTLPISVLAGYKGYLFPLFANSYGMDKAMISNVIVLCNALAFFASPITSNVEKMTGTRKILMYGGIVLGCIFMMFRLNDTIVWAIIALIVATFMIKSMEPATSTFWQERSLALKTDQGSAQIVVQVFEHSASSVRSSVLGFLLEVLGQTPACFAMGVYFGISTLLFSLFTRSKKKSVNG